MNRISDALRETIPFSLFRSEDQALTAQHARVMSYGAGEFIALHGDVWPCFFLMAQGEIECIKESLDGRSLSIVTLTPPEVFWGLAFFHEHARLPVS